MIIFCMVPFLGVFGSWVAIGLINRYAATSRRQVTALLGGLGIIIVVYGFAFRLISSPGRGYISSIPFGDMILLLSAICILLRTSIAIRRKRQYVLALVCTAVMLALIVPVAMKVWVEYPVVRAQNCYITSALARTALSLETWRAQHGEYPDDLYGYFTFEQSFTPAECDRYVAATSRFIHVFGYAQPYWLYRRTTTGYDLGYFLPWPIFADTRLGNRVCLYDQQTAQVACGYNDWGAFTGVTIARGSKE